MNPKLFKTEIELVEGSIYEVKALKKGYYDQQASGYDKLISNPVYNKIMWGNLPANYTEFCQQGLDDNKGDVVVDMGCGTLNFTHKVYAKNHSKQLYLCDLSLEMLRIGKKKLMQNETDFAKIVLLRADALNMPFTDNCVDTVLSFGIFHIFENPSSLIAEITRILKPGGKVYLTSLCMDRKFSA